MINSTIPKIKPPYWIGFFCIVPLIGAILGIVMIIRGMSKYKDRLFAIIGALGITWTILLYSILFYTSKNFGAFTKGWESLSQTQLNELMKSVESYKLQHGKYPDNLQDLLKDDKSIVIFDAIQTGRGNRDIYYQYEKKGEGYVLFSAGLDGIPHTADDLYPDTTNSKALGMAATPGTDTTSLKNTGTPSITKLVPDGN